MHHSGVHSHKGCNSTMLLYVLLIFIVLKVLFKKNLAKLIYKVQYAIEGRLAEGKRSRLWNKILKKYIDFINNSKTRLIRMSPAHAMTLEEVESKPSSKAKRAIGRYEEIKLKKGTAIRYLLKSGELKSDHRH